MAVTVSTLRKYSTGTAASGNWTRFDLPAKTRQVQVEVDGAAYVDGPGGGYTDGAARSSGGRATAVGEVVPILFPANMDAPFIWVCGNGGARTVTLYPCGSEALR